MILTSWLFLRRFVIRLLWVVSCTSGIRWVRCRCGWGSRNRIISRGWTSCVGCRGISTERWSSVRRWVRRSGWSRRRRTCRAWIRSLRVAPTVYSLATCCFLVHCLRRRISSFMRWSMFVETSRTCSPCVILLLTIGIGLFSWTRGSILVLFRALIWFGIIHRIIIRTAASSIVHRSLISPSTTSSQWAQDQWQSRGRGGQDLLRWVVLGVITKIRSTIIRMRTRSWTTFHRTISIFVLMFRCTLHACKTTTNVEDEPFIVTYPRHLHRCLQYERLFRSLKLFSRFRRFRMRTFDGRAHF